VHLQTVIALIVYEEAFEKTLASYDWKGISQDLAKVLERCIYVNTRLQ
jgi:hypothetical protein